MRSFCRIIGIIISQEQNIPQFLQKVNDARISEHVRRVSIGVLGEGNHELSPSLMGSEDFV